MISDEACSWPMRATDKALKGQFPSAETEMGIVLSQVWPRGRDEMSSVRRLRNEQVFVGDAYNNGADEYWWI